MILTFLFELVLSPIFIPYIYIFIRCILFQEPFRNDLRTEAWTNVVSRIKNLMLNSFSRIISKFEDAMRQERERRTEPDWTFTKYFTLQVKSFPPMILIKLYRYGANNWFSIWWMAFVAVVSFIEGSYILQTYLNTWVVSMIHDRTFYNRDVLIWIDLYSRYQLSIDKLHYQVVALRNTTCQLLNWFEYIDFATKVKSKCLRIMFSLLLFRAKAENPVILDDLCCFIFCTFRNLWHRFTLLLNSMRTRSYSMMNWMLYLLSLLSIILLVVRYPLVVNIFHSR